MEELNRKCLTCEREMKCPICDEKQPSISLVHELIKANSAYCKLSEQFEVAQNFIRKIIKDWECDPNHAEAILNELERMK